ncbi:MAG: hypothetical protein B7Z55_08850 [Planctomycetales bacterium 12-60-4]|nr:MAG: hypothetical protein B7Z55_08850 [Planctomycetales bacterium 12-60-4]
MGARLTRAKSQFGRLIIMSRWMVLLVAMACCGCGADSITLANYEKIQPGMTKDEVEAILGPARQNYQQGILTWSSGGSRIITIVFDDRGLVDKKDMEGL